MPHPRCTSLLLPACALGRLVLPASGAETIPFPEEPYVAQGMHRDDVQAQLGAPTAKLSADVWVYQGFRAKNRPPGQRYDALAGIFSDDRVTKLRLTDSRHLRAVIAPREQPATPPQEIARKKTPPPSEIAAKSGR